MVKVSASSDAKTKPPAPPLAHDPELETSALTAPVASSNRLDNVLSGKLFVSEKALFGFKQLPRFYRLRSDGSLLLFNDQKFSREKLVGFMLCGTVDKSMSCFRKHTTLALFDQSARIKLTSKTRVVQKTDSQFEVCVSFALTLHAVNHLWVRNWA